MFSSRNAKVPGKQDEVERPPAPSMVLPSLRETMQRRKRVQMPRPIRGPSPPDARRWRERRQTHCRLFESIPARLCPTPVSEVRPCGSLYKFTDADVVIRFGTKRVFANRVYQEFIQDKNHLHMNATRWVTLTEFVKYLGRSGIARVDETDKGWFIAWIDNSPKALAKQEASLKKERATMSDEQRERLLIAEQIERAKQEAGPSSGSTSPPPEERALQRDDGAEKVVLSFAMKPTAPAESTPAPATGGLKLNPLKPGVNPLKRPNVFKTSAASTSKPSDHADSKKRPASAMSAAERLILEEQERKRRRMERDGVIS